MHAHCSISLSLSRTYMYTHTQSNVSEKNHIALFCNKWKCKIAGCEPGGRLFCKRNIGFRALLDELTEPTSVLGKATGFQALLVTHRNCVLSPSRPSWNSRISFLIHPFNIFMLGFEMFHFRDYHSPWPHWMRDSGSYWQRGDLSKLCICILPGYFQGSQLCVSGILSFPLVYPLGNTIRQVRSEDTTGSSPHELPSLFMCWSLREPLLFWWWWCS